MAQLSPEKQKKIMEKNQLSKELSKEKSDGNTQKQGSDIPLNEKDELGRKEPEVENIFDNPDEGEDFGDIMMGEPVVVPLPVG